MRIVQVMVCEGRLHTTSFRKVEVEVLRIHSDQVGEGLLANLPLHSHTRAQVRPIDCTEQMAKRDSMIRN